MLLAVFHHLHSTYEQEGRARAALLDIFLDALLTYDFPVILSCCSGFVSRRGFSPHRIPLSSPRCVCVYGGCDGCGRVEALRVPVAC